MSDKKFTWKGKLISIQPRIRLIRSFDERQHNYLGYILLIDGEIKGEEKRFSIGIGKTTQVKYEFQSGYRIKGRCALPVNPAKEPADYYKASKLKVTDKNTEKYDPPPWHGIPPTLKEYRNRGHRRLSKKTYNTKCISCKWGCLMAVEIIIDHWNPDNKEYRTETFCYGPKSCENYKPGPNRKVPGRNGMVWEEPDWVDEEATSHRDSDE